METEIAMYHYAECGLDNVLIEGLPPCKDDDGDDVITIPNVNSLHRAIAEGIVEHNAGMSGAELRFLRTEMGMTQAELAKVVHHDGQSVGRWERGEVPIDPAAEAVVRMLATEKLRLKIADGSVDAISARCVPTAAPQRIVIDGRNPADYRLLAA
jgi:DNA-binding transcriptional regulator YiaG